MDLGFLGEIHLNAQFFSAILSIVIIDLVLAGDNAVVIAMAVKKLTGRQRTWGIAMGAGGAVLVRVVCTFGETIETLVPTMELTSVDLPLPDLPTRP